MFYCDVKKKKWCTPIILATQEAEIGRITIESQPRQTVHVTPSQPVKAGCGGMCLFPSYAGGINRRIKVQASPGHKLRSYMKST
jgi:hypothetical protein